MSVKEDVFMTTYFTEVEHDQAMKKFLEHAFEYNKQKPLWKRCEDIGEGKYVYEYCFKECNEEWVQMVAVEIADAMGCPIAITRRSQMKKERLKEIGL